MKYLIISALLILSVAIGRVFYLQNRLDETENLLNFYKNNNKLLENELKKRDENEIKLTETKKELDKLAKEDSFDWSMPLPDSAIIKRLRKD